MNNGNRADMDDLLRDLDSDSDAEVGTDEMEVDAGAGVVKEALEDITQQSLVVAKMVPMLEQIDTFSQLRINKKTEYDFLISANDTSVEATAEQQLVHEFLKRQYSKRFPELESLIPLPLDFAKVILVLQNSWDIDSDRLSFLGKEKILLLTMSALQAKENGKPLPQDVLDVTLKACHLLIELNAFKLKIQDYVASRLVVFAPNLTAIVGAQTAAQFMSLVGGLAELAKTPSCNVAALGNKRTVSMGLGQHGIRQQGFLYYSDIIQNVVPDLRKQAMRITAGKLILAARIDYASNNSSGDASQGLKWRQEILDKIEKLEEPPEVVATKALPVPIDRKAKKRGGRRYRKMKEKFELSDLRKAQDRVVFGQAEKTVTDAFGEEVGLGMLSSLSRTPQNVNNRAKMSKGMRNRLQAGESTKLFDENLINFPQTKAIEQPPQKRIKK